MPSRSYGELISQAIVNCEFFNEKIQSTGTLAVTLAVNSTYRFARSKIPCLWQIAGSECLRASSNVAPAADCTSNFAFEWAGIPTNTDYYIWSMGVGTGGIQYRWRGDAGAIYLNMYTSAGALAREIYNTTAFTFDFNSRHHFIIQSSSAGAAGSLWIDGISIPVSYGGAGATARGADDRWYITGISGGRVANYLFRSWQSSLNQEEVAALYDNYRNLVVPSKV
jgi:hypothetical protein